MANQSFQGKHFKVTADSIELFGLMGTTNEAHWTLGVPIGREQESLVMAQEALLPGALNEIEVLIQIDRSTRQEERIAEVLISNIVGVRLFLAGELPIFRFRDAREDESSIRLRLPLLGRERVVVIRSRFALQEEISTRDSTGKAV